MRSRISKSKVERRTYVSTKAPQPQLTVFYESLEANVPHDLKTITRKVENSRSPVVHLCTISAAEASSLEDLGDLLAVHRDGEIGCYDGSTLQEKWISPAMALATATSYQNSVVEFTQLTSAFSAKQGILKGRQDVFSIFPQEIAEEGFNPAILVMVVRGGPDADERFLHIVSMPRRSSQSHKKATPVEPLVTVELPVFATSRLDMSEASFSLQASAGILQQLGDGTLTTFDLTGTLPQEQASFEAPGITSFLRLSSTSIMASSESSLTIFNPKYHSILASRRHSSVADTEDPNKGRVNGPNAIIDPYKFIAFFPKLNIVIAIAGHRLIGIPLQGQQDRHGKVRATGLLIDSLGCSVKEQLRPVSNDKRTKRPESMTLGQFLKGCEGQDEEFPDEMAYLKSIFPIEDMTPEELDSAMASFLELEWPEDDIPLVNGSSPRPSSNGNAPTTEFKFPSQFEVDRRGSLYALSKIFAWRKTGKCEPELAIDLYAPNTFSWLALTGQMTVHNVQLALTKYANLGEEIPSGQLVAALVDVDRDMDVLSAVVSKNQLSAVELLHAILKLMDSLGLLGENPTSKQGLLTNGDVGDGSEDVDKTIHEEEVLAKMELDVAEYVLGPGSSRRGEALSIAISKLHKHPHQEIVKALRSTYTNQETVCFIYVLRYELARGGWTSKYTEVDEDDIISGDCANNAVVLIANLLNNCIDAIGAGGWLSGDARLVDDDPFEAEDLINSLKLEVSAALQGAEESAYLRGLLGEVARYSEAVERAIPKSKKRKDAPVTLPALAEELMSLPLGLKTEKQVSIFKVGAGGAVQKRTMREIGHHKSRKVGLYSREKIVV